MGMICGLALAAAVAAGGAEPAALELPFDAAALPADAARAWAEVADTAQYAAQWAPEWKHTVAKAQVADTLSRSLAALRAAAAREGGNLDLLLATGVAARWAHNLDLEGAADTCLTVLRRAAKAFPADPRPRWQLGTSLCEMMHVVEGMELLLAVDGEAKPEALPAAFWRDEMRCAGFTFMPVHQLRAFDLLRKQGTAGADEEDAALRAAKLLKDPPRELALREAWNTHQLDKEWLFVSRPCGFAARVAGEQGVNPQQVRNGTCGLQVDLGPFKGKTGDVVPSVLVMARSPSADQSLDDFLALFSMLKDAKASKDGCRWAGCRVLEARMADAYPNEGGGFVMATVLARPEPAYPGLALERPGAPPPSPDGKVHYYRPQERLTRYPGTLYYLILLDSTVSAEPEARAAYRKVLDELIIE